MPIRLNADERKKFRELDWLISAIPVEFNHLRAGGALWNAGKNTNKRGAAGRLRLVLMLLVVGLGPRTVSFE